MPDTTAQFTEVLQVTVDVPKFQQGLEDLKQAYLQFIQQLGGEANNVIGVGVFAGLKDEIQKVLGDISAVNQQVLESVNISTSAVADLVGKQDQLQEAAAQKQRLRVKKTAEEEIAAIESVAKVKEELGSGVVEKASPAEKFARGISIEQEGIVNQFEAATKKLQDAQKKSAEEIAIEQQGLLDKQIAQQEAADKRRAASQKKTAEEIATEQQGIQDKFNASQEAADKARAARQKATAEEIAIEQQGLVDRFNEAQEKATAKQKGGFFQQLTSDIGESITSMAVFLIKFQLVIGAINAVKTVIEAPFKALADGVKYLQETERAADELSGVLFANVKFTDALGNSFQRSRDLAKELIPLFQDLAAKSNVKVGSLEDIFKALSQTGGAQLVKNTGELVDLTNLFAVGMKAAGIEALGTRRTVQEMEALLNGQVKANNQILTLLKLTPNQWNEILRLGRLHGDLLERLAPLFEPYRLQVKAMAKDQLTLIEQWELLKKRIEAVASAGLFEEINKDLKGLSKWVQDNRDSIIGFLEAVAEKVIAITHAIIDLTAAIGGLFAPLSGWGSILGFITDQLLVFVKLITLGIKLQGDMLSDSPWEKAGADIKKFNAEMFELTGHYRTIKEITNGVTRAHEINPESHGKNLLRVGITGDPPPQEGKSQLGVILSDLKKEKDLYLEQVEKIKEASKSLREATANDLAARKINHQQAAERIAADLDLELSKINKLAKDYEDLEKATRAQVAALPITGTFSKEQKEKVLNELDASAALERTRRLKNFAQEHVAVANAEKAANAEQAQLRQQHFDLLIKLQKEEVKQEDAIATAQHADGLLTDLQFFDKKVAIAQSAHDIEISLIDKAIRAEAAGTVARAKEVAKRVEEDQRFTNLQQQQATQRERIAKQEADARVAFFDKQRAAELQNLEQQGGLSKTLLPGSADGTTIPTLKLHELEQLTAETQARLELARAKNAESKETRDLSLALQHLIDQRTTTVAAAISAVNSSTNNPAIRGILAQSIINGEAARLQARATDAGNDINAFNARTRGQGSLSKADVAELDKLNERFVQASVEVEKFSSTVEAANPTLTDAFTSLINNVFKFDFASAWEAATSSITDGAAEQVAVIGNAVSEALGSITSAINAFKQGSAQGGVLGGIGGVLNQFAGPLSDIPVVGQFIPAIAGVLSFVGGLFTQAAQHIADDVKKSFQGTLEGYHAGSITLVETIRQVQQEENDAISRLSGTKGGKTQLDKILPDIQKQLLQLQQEQTKIQSTFELQLFSLRLQSDTLTGVNKQWQDINKQVKDYLDSGGNAANAAEFLSLQLESIKNSAITSFDSATQTAIGDAIKLNDLLLQREKLTDDFNKKQFDVINSDSIERRQGAVSKGEALKVLRDQYNLDLDNLNTQLDLEQKKVSKETELFGLTTNISELHRRDEELQLKALDIQIQKWQDLKKIIDGINVGSDGAFAAASGLFNATPNYLTVNLTIGPPPPGTDPSQYGTVIGDSIASELIRRGRMTPVNA